MAISKEAAVSAAWHAVGKIAGKSARRELLEGPAVCKVDLVVAGTVAGQHVELPCVGELKVNPDGVRISNCNPPPNEVLGLMLARLAPRVRASLIAQTLAHFTEHHELPAFEPKFAEQAKSFMEQLRTRVEVPNKGTVVFVATG